MNVTAHATRVDGWWAIEVPAIPGLFTQARRLDQIRELVIDAAAMLGIEVSDVHIEPLLNDEERALLDHTARARSAAQAAATEASTLSREAIARLRADGFTVRDVAALIGISAQRVSILTK